MAPKRKQPEAPIALVTVTWSKTVTMPASFDEHDATHVAMATSMAWIELQPQEGQVVNVQKRP